MKKLVNFGMILMLAFGLLATSGQARAAPTTLTAGDIAIIGFNFDDPDQMAFVLLVNVGSGTQINFTDNGWRSNNTFRSGEGTFTWTAAADLPAGTIVMPAVSGVAFSSSGDQILAYQGTSSSPIFIYALNSEGAGVWQSNAGNSATSALPLGLVNGTSAVALNEIDNAKYVGMTSGSKSQLLAAIGNQANWSGSDSTRQTMPSGSFSVQGSAPTSTLTSTFTPTFTSSPTATFTFTPTPTFTPTFTPTATFTSTFTSTPTSTPSSTPTLAPTNTPTLTPSGGPTALAAGDIAIIGFNFDDPDEMAFVVLVDVGAGTQINFTDNGWQSSNTFRTGEGTFTWTAPANLTAGTVVNPAVSSVAFSTSGDQILAYQGSSSSPTFIYALNSEGAAVWQADATSSNTSALPAGLVNGTSAVALNEIDNAVYAGITSGTKSQLLAAIGNPANWTGSDTVRQAMPSGSFTVQTGPPTNTPTPGPTNTPGPTPTATNTPSSPSCPPATVTAIGAIQGTGTTTPFPGQQRTVRGVVVADFQGSNELSGFFVQDGGDGDSASSDGLFVPSTIAVNLGDPVQVTGTVGESSSRTQFTAVQSVTICGNAPNVTPVSVALPITTQTDLEKYEGMLVTFPQTLVVTENYGLGRYGEVVLASERLWNPTNVTTPGTAANALQAENDLKRIILDDGSTTQNLDPIKYPAPGLTFGNTLRSGDTTTGLTGVMDFASGAYRVHATSAPSWTHANGRTSSPSSVGGTLRVASFNVLNYFNGPTFPTSRGATTAAEFTRQRDKIINAIVAMNADIIGLIEIENDGYGSGSAIQDLVNGLNAAAPSGTTYAFINPGVSQVGTDEITVGIVYRTQTVTPVGPARIKTNGAFSSLNRPPMAQTFQQISGGGRLTVAVNHFKSKGSACAGDPDTGDGQGNCNLTRVNAANDLTGWLATDPTGSGDPDFLIIGDLNAYAKEDPITAIKNAGYTNLTESFLGQFAYSYVFQGQSGYLDHALATGGLAAQVSGVTEWHINCDEPVVLDYNTEFKSAGQQTSLYSTAPYRSSDHDPVIVGLTLNP